MSIIQNEKSREELLQELGDLRRRVDGLQAQLEQFRVARELSPDGFTILRPLRDADGRVVDFTWVYENPAAARLNGTDPDAVVGRRLLELFPGHRGSPFLDAYIKVAETGEPRMLEGPYAGESPAKPTWFRIAVMPIGKDIAILAQDVTDQRLTDERAARQNAVLLGIARIFHQALTCQTEEQLGRVCLAVAEEVTQSKFGFIGQINPGTGKLDDIAISDPGWEGCQMHEGPRQERRAPVAFTVHGLYGRVLKDGRGFFTNEPASHPDRVGLPQGHPPLTAFLGVPLIHAGEILGMVGLGNRDGGYETQDLQSAEALAPAIVQALLSKRAEETFRTSEERYRSLFDNMLDGFAYCQMLFDVHNRPQDFVYLAVNEAFERLTDLKNVVGKRVTEVIPGIKELSPEVFEIYGRVVATGTPERFEIHFKPLDAWLSVSAYAAGDGRFVAVFDNITKRKRAEDAARESQALLHAVMNNTSDPVYVKDRNSRVLLCNPALEKVAGKPCAEIIGKSDGEYYDNLVVGFALRQNDLRVMASGCSQTVEETVITPDGERTFLSSKAPYRSESGEIIGIIGISHDITDRKRAEQSLGESVQLYRGVVENTTAIILRVDLQGIIRFANPRALDFFGYSAEELIGKHAVGTIVPDRETSGRDLAEMVDQIAENPDHFHSNANENLRKNGERVWMEWTNSGVYDENGALKEFLSVGIDATERKKAQEELRQSERRYRTLHESLRDPFVQVGMDGQVIECNDAFSQMLGYSPEELRTLTYQDMTPPQWRAAEELIVRQQIIARGYSDVYQKEYRRKDGTIFPVELRTILLRDDAGRPCAMWGIVRDIAERKQAEERARLLSEIRAQLLASDQPQQIIDGLCRKVMDHLGCDVFFNFLVDDRAGRLRLNACAGIPQEAAGQIEWLDYGAAVCGCVARDGQRIVVEHIQDGDDPRTSLVRAFGVQAYASHPLVNEGRTIGTLSFGSRAKAAFRQDELALMKVVADHVAIAMQRIRLLESLERHARAAQAASEAKSQFLANMSHEIRTPMTAVLGFAELLARMDCSAEEQREYLQTIQQSGKSLLQLIDDILDLSKIEAGGAKTETVDCAPRQIVEEVVSLMDLRAREKNLALQVSYRFPLPLIISTDPGRVRQILVNLVGNAIKFTSAGRVGVEVSYSDHRRPTIQFAVSDTGIGIHADHLEEIFQPFSQADPSMTRHYGGTGLGLTISRRLAQAMGGELTVQSEVGQGSKFTLTLDAGAVAATSLVQSYGREIAAQSPLARESARLAGRILLVEDTPANQYLIKVILAKAGLDVDVTDNGEQAWRMATESSAAGKPYDLILMDMQMPGVDGYETTRRLRADGWQSPIVAITAHAMEGDRERCLTAGCDEYVPKPVSRDKLFDVIRRFLT